MGRAYNIFTGIMIWSVLAAAVVVVLNSCNQQQSARQSSGQRVIADGNTGEEENGMQEQGTMAVDGGVSGQQAYSGVSALDLRIGNGAVVVASGDVEEGAAEFSWEITKAKGVLGSADVDELQIHHSLENGLLVIKDEYTGSKLASRPHLKLTVTVSPEVDVDTSLGNGELELGNLLLGDASLGNGELTLSGELTDDAEISVGNGRIDADLLVKDGSHNFAVGNGSITLNVRPGSSFRYSASTGVGGINASGGQITSKARSQGFVGSEAEGQVAAGDGDVGLSAGNGSITITAN